MKRTATIGRGTDGHARRRSGNTRGISWANRTRNSVARSATPTYTNISHRFKEVVNSTWNFRLNLVSQCKAYLQPLAMAASTRLRDTFVMGTLTAVMGTLSKGNRIHVCCNGELGHNCHNDHHTQAPHKKRLCSCGKCSPAALFEHSCPLAYDPQLAIFLRRTSINYYESNFTDSIFLLSDEDRNSPRTALPTPGDLRLPILLQAFSCDRLQCFLYVRAHECTSLQDDYGVEDLLHSKTNPVINTDKETLTIQLVELTQKSNTFTSQLLYPIQHLLIKTKFQLPCKHVHHNKVETTRYPVDIVNLILLLLFMSGDIELNPGPPGTSKL